MVAVLQQRIAVLDISIDCIKKLRQSETIPHMDVPFARWLSIWAWMAYHIFMGLSLGLLLGFLSGGWSLFFKIGLLQAFARMRHIMKEW